MDSKGLRVFVYGTLYFFVALILFFCYAILSDQEEGASAPGLVACGYCFGMVFISLYISVRICPGKCMENLKTESMNLIFAIAFMISICFSVIGYWAVAGDEGISEFSAYYVGFSFFLALMGIQMAVDFKCAGYNKVVYHE